MPERTPAMRLTPLGDSAVLVESQLPAGVASDWVRQWIQALESDAPPGFLGTLGGVGSLAVFYSPAEVARHASERPFQAVCRWIESRSSVLQSAAASAPQELFIRDDLTGFAGKPTETGAPEAGAAASPGAEGELTVLRGGTLTTVQDLGRARFRNRGVPVGGALDRLAHRVANLLVGNPEGAPGLECTLSGPDLRFAQPTWVALCGASVAGQPNWQPRRVEAGEVLSLGAFESGARAYVAVAGGLVVPSLLGSGSTHLPGGAGGHEGRPLREGDRLRIGPSSTQYADTEHWSMARDLLPHYQSAAVVRLLPGPQAAQLPPEGRRDLEKAEFTVLPDSDRAALRLGGAPLDSARAVDIPPEPMTQGAVYLRSDGRPAVALADGPAIGVRPKIGYVITVDLPILAQLRPGDTVRFSPCVESDAEELLLAREHALAKLKEGLAGKRLA